MKIGFIGTGVMGKSMVRHLLKENEVTIYTRTKAKALPLIEEGAKWVDSIPEVCKGNAVVFTMVGFPSDVREVYDLLFEAGEAGSIFVDCTTSSPALAKELYEEGKAKGISVIDAPVSGGDVGAQKGTLTIMCGGDKDAFEKVLPLLSQIGTNVQLQGGPGAGQHTKMCNQIAIATNMIGVAEAVVYGQKAGLDMEHVLESIATGAAGSFSLSNYTPRILKGDYQPGFYIKHFIKDMKIALEEAEKMGLKLPGLALAKELYEELAARGLAEKGTQAIIAWYD
ncbi:MAG: NAD(P)-dependent oxidoreductase [Erysipelotrichaceae bacterium]|jgi:3-hydroxyisobutyrate dehydrogenase|nr:NAD(P)-dependent oxidoreductase [Erysipelotrichaceae bacterium]